MTIQEAIVELKRLKGLDSERYAKAGVRPKSWGTHSFTKSHMCEVRGEDDHLCRFMRPDDMNEIGKNYAPRLSELFEDWEILEWDEVAAKCGKVAVFLPKKTRGDA